MSKIPALILAIMLVGCAKENTGKQTIEMQIANPYFDSIYVSVQNSTTPALSVSKQLPPQAMPGSVTSFTANDGDNIIVHATVKPNKKWGRHPLFLNEVNIDTTLTVSANTAREPLPLLLPAHKVISLSAMVGANQQGKYVRATIRYSGREDSLFFARPGELAAHQPIGYLRPSDIQHIVNPVTYIYTGETKPYAEKETGRIWESDKAPSPNAGSASIQNYLFTVN